MKWPWFKRQERSASIAKQRLQVLISHHAKASFATSDQLKHDLVMVLAKHLQLPVSDLMKNMVLQHTRHGHQRCLELNITLQDFQT
jgi:cell division topological specificity factor MinE